jgi:hypothetical protein
MLKALHALFLATGLCWASASLAAVEISGIKLEDSITIADTKLQLNGAGIRYKGPFKVYVGDLYTTQPVKSLDELLAAPGPKRLTMTFLREINSADFGKLLTRGIEDNTSKAEMSKIIPGMIKMGEIFAANKSFAPGDVCALEWDPAKGLSIWAKGKLQSEPFKDPAFFKALMSIWFGQNPADWKLKDAMLGAK